MKLLLLFFALSPVFLVAEECSYDESAYTNFVTEYAASHNEVKLHDKYSFTADIKGITASITGGGCHHIGFSVKIENHEVSSEDEFLSLLIASMREFGSWIGYISYIEEVVSEKNWHTYDDGTYFFDMDGMAVLVGTFSDDGFFMEFYLN